MAVKADGDSHSDSVCKIKPIKKIFNEFTSSSHTKFDKLNGSFKLNGPIIGRCSMFKELYII